MTEAAVSFAGNLTDDPELRHTEAGIARVYVREAQQAADRLGHDGNDLATAFGPTNVALRTVAVPVELGDAGEALQVARTIDPSPLAPNLLERRRCSTSTWPAPQRRRRGRHPARSRADRRGDPLPGGRA